MVKKKFCLRRPSEWCAAVIAVCLVMQLASGCASAEAGKADGDEVFSSLVKEYRDARTDRDRYLVMKRVAYAISPFLLERDGRVAPLSIDRDRFVSAFGPPDREADRRIDYLFVVDCVRVFFVTIGFDEGGKSIGAIFTSDGWGESIDLEEERDIDCFLKLFARDYDIILSKVWVDAFALKNVTLSQCCSELMDRVNGTMAAIGCKKVNISVENDDNRRYSFAFRGGCVQSLLKEIELYVGYLPTDNFFEMRKDPKVNPVIVLHNRRSSLHSAVGSNCVE